MAQALLMEAVFHYDLHVQIESWSFWVYFIIDMNVFFKSLQKFIIIFKIFLKMYENFMTYNRCILSSTKNIDLDIY
jgi:hypothetical protein